MLTRKLAGSAALLTGVTAIALTIAACGPTAASSGAPGSISTSASPATSTAPPPMTSSGSPKAPVSSPPQGANLPVGTPPQGGTLVPLPPYTPVPSSQIIINGTTPQSPSAVQTAEGGRVLIFHEEQAGCEQVSAQVVGQDANQVVVDVIVSSSASAGRMCPMIVRVVPVTVALQAPLGSRKVVFNQTMRH
ncbi:MAG TPA: hypothetical protein VJ914_20615 [Pseudonocardiaceae bacterium]|nr:hypothetical protein [Pseudonocardiaceae bacterium]